MQTTLNVVVWCCVWWYSPTHSMDSLETKPLETANKIKYKEYWFDQYLDHFTITDNTMWKQVFLNYILFVVQKIMIIVKNYKIVNIQNY